MLGTRADDVAIDLVSALADADAPRVLAELARIAELTPDFASVLEDLIGMLHQLALAQQVPGTLREDDPHEAQLRALSQRLSAEDVQLYYQVLLTGQADLALAPDPRSGLEMVLLRALAFRPADVPASNAPIPEPQGAGPASGLRSSSNGSSNRGTTQARRAAPGALSAVAEPSAQPSVQRPVKDPARHQPSDHSRTQSIGEAAGQAGRAGAQTIDPPSEQAQATRPAAASSASADSIRSASPAGEALETIRLRCAGDWDALVMRLGLHGLALELARHCALHQWDGRQVSLILRPSHLHLRTEGAQARLQEALSKALGQSIRLDIGAAESADQTPAQRQEQQQAQRLAEAEQILLDDPIAKQVRERFDAEWIPGTLTALGT
jgi:DNA polymerase-3 subunit gamma/tau